MAPEDYIEGLKAVRQALNSIEVDINHAIYKMERRLETGYENMETESRRETKSAHDSVKILKRNLQMLMKTPIEF